MPRDEPTAFFSYSREDSAFALRLAEDLKAAGANVWLDQLDIAPGQRWARAVEEALNNSPRVLVILSPASVSSTHVEDEVAFALEEHKTVIPVFYQDCKVPFQLRPFQYVDFRADYDRGLKIMLKALCVGGQSAMSAAAVSAVPLDSKPTTATTEDRDHAVEQARLAEEECARQEQERLQQEEQERQAEAEQTRLAEGERERQEQARKDAAEKARLEQEEHARQAAAESARLEQEKRVREAQRKAAAEKARQEREQQERSAAEQAQLAEEKRARQEQKRKAAERTRIESKSNATGLLELRLNESPERSATVSPKGKQSRTRSLTSWRSIWGRSIAIGAAWTLWAFCLAFFQNSLYPTLHFVVLPPFFPGWLLLLALLIQCLNGAAFGVLLAFSLGWMRARFPHSYTLQLTAIWAAAIALKWIGTGLAAGMNRPDFGARLLPSELVAGIFCTGVAGFLTARLLDQAEMPLSSKKSYVIVSGYIAAMIASWCVRAAIPGAYMPDRTFVLVLPQLVFAIVGNAVVLWQLAGEG